ncbi:Fructokinase-1 [Dendrobium catenatum]|uniref:Fructokinase-1 n=1 Tax=Dendrobium catenatum TaxID=906689 RepID=A0A2I0WK71_9ASPA|nr:Fructokinase-1 [Dendrobium catenatum]
MGKLGDDEFGRMLVAILRENDVSDDGVTFDAGARTTLALFLYAPMASASLCSIVILALICFLRQLS